MQEKVQFLKRLISFLFVSDYMFSFLSLYSLVHLIVSTFTVWTNYEK